MGGSEKVHKFADVIYGWLLWQMIQTAVSFLQPKFMLVKAVNELDFKSLFIRPTGISGLTGGGISPENITLLVLKSVNFDFTLAVHSPKLNHAKTHFLSHQNV